MKKMIIFIGIPLLFSCTPEDVKEKDCNCNRVVDVFTFNVVGTTTSNLTKYYKYTTINDCTNVQRESGLTTQSVKIGDCK